MRPGDAASLARYVLKQAPQYNLDPNAVVAVSLQEGISGKVGDNGTSFGPFQLHVGGSYPTRGAPDPSNQNAANAWAWSPAGIDYALGRMQSVAGGLKGRKAVHAIVYSFERPADPASEYANAVKALPSSDGGPSSGGGGGGGIWSILSSGASSAANALPGGPVISAVTGAAGGAAGVVSSAESVASFLGKLTDPKYLLRGLEIAGGALIALLGLYLLARQAGLIDRAQGAVGTAAAVVQPELAPAVAAQRAKRQQRSAARSRRRELDRRYGAEAPF